MSTQEYNGWKNYATWRVNLELFDSVWLPEYFEHDQLPDDLADWCKDYAEEYIIQTTDGEQLVAGWALVFLNDVDWQSIAGHLLDAAEWPVATEDDQ